MLKRLLDHLCQIAHAFGHPVALLLLAAYSVAWLVVERWNIGWDGALAIITMVACIVIQASQNRDTAALKAQVAELLKATEGARDELADLDGKTEEEIARLRDQR